jgi:peptidoglycan/LPS O-acetylase OafA/YrhL
MHVSLKHKSELQSFRGIAALVVLIHHCFMYFNTGTVRYVAGELFFNAHAAVVAFYVLSGYVLSLALRGEQKSLPGYVSFLIRRIFRIYPALWVAMLIALVYTMVLKGVPLSVNVADPSWIGFRNSDPEWPRIVAAFLAIGAALPMPVWSIFAELVAAPIVPILFWSACYKPRWFGALFASLLLASFLIGQATRMNVGVYLVDFAIGVAACVWGSSFVAILRRKKIVPGVAILALLSLWFGRLIGPWSFEANYHSPGAALLEALSAATLIAIIANDSNRFSILRKSRLVSLGDISYSLYLIHLPILALVAGYLGDVLLIRPFEGSQPVAATFLILFIVLAICLSISAFIYRFVERPWNSIGRAIANRCNESTRPAR